MRRVPLIFGHCIQRFEYSFDHRLAKYQPFNRNLMRITDLQKQVGQLKYGKSEIISLLMQLPATNHVPASFAVDLMLYTVHIYVIRV